MLNIKISFPKEGYFSFLVKNNRYMCACASRHVRQKRNGIAIKNTLEICQKKLNILGILSGKRSDDKRLVKISRYVIREREFVTLGPGQLI